jgi:hypothetical protein
MLPLMHASVGDTELTVAILFKLTVATKSTLKDFLDRSALAAATYELFPKLLPLCTYSMSHITFARLHNLLLEFGKTEQSPQLLDLQNKFAFSTRLLPIRRRDTQLPVDVIHLINPLRNMVMLPARKIFPTLETQCQIHFQRSQEPIQLFARHTLPAASSGTHD